MTTDNNLKVLAVIPARYASSRFPGKPLALLGGKPIIDYAYSVACSVFDEVVVATDDERICDHMEKTFGDGSVMMTSPDHQSGTDRCGEVLRRLRRQGVDVDIVINLQGDEPFVEPSQLRSLVDCFLDPDVSIATLKTRIRSTEELLSPNNVKVVCGIDGRALYFSRQPIPFRRGVELGQWLEDTPYFKHVGIYAFRAATLEEVCNLEVGFLESCEKLEQLRWLEAGYRIAVRETSHANVGIDTPDDLVAAEKQLKMKKEKI